MARQMRLLVLVSLLLVMGCGGDNGGHHHDDPFIVESVSSTEWHIFRASGGPFDLISISVRPLRDAFGAPFLYNLQDTVGQPPSAEICVSNMPSWKAKKLRKPSQEKVLLEL
jgi:hypothetical protein